MPPVVGVNVVSEGQRCADELILGMSRGAWRQRSRVQPLVVEHGWGGEINGPCCATMRLTFLDILKTMGQTSISIGTICDLVIP
ncbi:hypothetical protein NQZ68_035591 [Dissostichus eleginoides]|nr:hypothetical protein NQZ68_035591 [Dissostichus eleginoides]